MTKKNTSPASADRNFDPALPMGAFTWRDAFDRALSPRGLAWVRRNRRERTWSRIPSGMCAGLRPEVVALGRCPAGVHVAFASDTRDLAVDVTLEGTAEMSHMPLTGSSGVELYLQMEGVWRPLATAMPRPGQSRYQRQMLADAPPERRNFRLYLPLYAGVSALRIGFSRGAHVWPEPPASARPVVFYGTSITQGGCANTAGSDYVSAVGRILGRDVINLGFSGNGKGEPEMAGLLATIDASVFVIDYLANVDADRLAETLPGFIQTLRTRRPGARILLLSQIVGNQCLFVRSKFEEILRKRDVMLRVYLDRRSRDGDALHFLDGTTLVPPGEAGLFVDGGHPTSAGFAAMAEAVALMLRLFAPEP